MEKLQNPVTHNKSKLSKVLLSLLLVIPTGVLIYFPTGFLTMILLGFEFLPVSIFDHLILYLLLGSAISISFLPTGFVISRIYQNKKIFVVFLLIFILLAGGLASSVFGRAIYRGQKVSEEIEKAKAAFQIYEPTYLPSGAKLSSRWARDGKVFYENYTLGKNHLEIIQTTDLNSMGTFRAYKCALGIETVDCVEGVSWDEVEVNGQMAFYITHPPVGKGERRYVSRDLAWKTDGTFIMIATSLAPLEKEDFMKIAESMRPGQF